MHCLTHLPAECAKFGPLDNFSCFKFENALGSLKVLVDSPKAPLKSLANKLAQKSTFVSKASRNFMNEKNMILKCAIANDPIAADFDNGKTYKSVYFRSNRLSISEPDCYFATSKKKIYRIDAILDSDETGVKLVCRQFDKLKYAYYVPTDTHRFESSELGIFRLIHLSDTKKFIDIENVLYKCVVHCFDDKLYSYPLLSLK